MLSSNLEYGPWPRSGEIDIMEWVGNAPREAFGTIHFGNDFASRVFLSHVLRQELSSFSDDFHNFAVEAAVQVGKRFRCVIVVLAVRSFVSV